LRGIRKVGGSPELLQRSLWCGGVSSYWPEALSRSQRPFPYFPQWSELGAVKRAAQNIAQPSGTGFLSEEFRRRHSLFFHSRSPMLWLVPFLCSYSIVRSGYKGPAPFSTVRCGLILRGRTPKSKALQPRLLHPRKPFRV